jgi:hypothetical protein
MNSVILKPQDVLVALKLLAVRGKRPSFAHIAADLFMSTSEVHAAVKRAQASHLLHGRELGERPNIAAMQEFLIHGLKYVFPPTRGQMTRGIPTSYAANPLRRWIRQGDDPPPVWPSSEGHTRGLAFEPLYRSVPAAAKRDPRLYELLSLLDAMRGGRARERTIAEKELIKRLNQTKRE